jgi:hypothetical protein
MASNERSLGWNTSTSHDGATTYASDRMIAMEQKTLGNGILFVGSNLAVSGASTTLTIADGAALINGYFYESTSASTIPTSTLNGTYTLALIANGSGSSYTVARSTADTTTVLVNTVRMALATGTQLGIIGAANYISIATVIVGATGIISSVTSLYPLAIGRQMPNTQYAVMTGGTASLTSASTYYDLTGYATSAASSDASIGVNAGAGEISIRTSGLYCFSLKLHFDTNTTGNRNIQVQNLDMQFMTLSAAQLPNNGISVYQAEATAYISVTPGTPKVFWIQAWASNAGRSVTDSTFLVARV